MNIIYDENKLRLANNEVAEGQLEDVRFYIPTEVETIYCILTDTDGNVDACPLQKIGINKKYAIYSLVLNELHCNDIITKFQLTTFNSISNPIECKINCNNFKFINQLRVLQDLNSALSQKYSKILELTQLNIDIYNKIKGGVDE